MAISFEVGDDLQDVVCAVEAFALEQVRPRLREAEQEGLSPQLARALFELGLCTLALPESLGGLDELDVFSSAGPSRPDPKGYDRIDYRGPDKEVGKSIREGRGAYLRHYRRALQTHRRRTQRKRQSGAGASKLRKTRKTRRPVFPLGTYRMLRFEQVKVAVPKTYCPPTPPAPS